MILRKPMTKAEIHLFKESVIREYRNMTEQKARNTQVNQIMQRFMKIMPLNIAIGVIAAVAFTLIYGWDYLLRSVLQSIIWITLMSSILAALVKKN